MCQPTTLCSPLQGLGFMPGAYVCICRDGYYFPDTSATTKAYSGSTIEAQFRELGNVEEGLYRCAACAAGCDTCNDASPCLHERNRALVVPLLLLNTITVIGIAAVAVATYLYRFEPVIKSASPIFLELMCLGAVIMCIQMYVQMSATTVAWCRVRIWPINLGFFLMYSSLILKTWRISMIFTVGTQKRVRLPDQVLMQRLGLLLLLVVTVLATWTGTNTPEVRTLKTTDELKFFMCDHGPWEYGIIGAEILFLLYGVYLCFTVRKAPAHFNESKHITWAVYNAIILGSFTSLLSRLFVSVVGPDMVIVLQFAQIQVYVTITILLIFVPKFHAVIKKIDMPNQNMTLMTTNTIQSVTGQLKKSQVSPLPPILKAHASTQTAPFDQLTPPDITHLS